MGPQEVPGGDSGAKRQRLVMTATDLDIKIKWVNEKQVMKQIQRAHEELDKLRKLTIEIEVLEVKQPWYIKLKRWLGM